MRLKCTAVARFGLWMMISTLAPCLVGSQDLSAAAPTAPSTIVVQWNSMLLQAVGLERFGPVMTARALAVLHTCIFDAWAGG